MTKLQSVFTWPLGSLIFFTQSLVGNPLLEVGDFIDIYASASATGRYESNVLRNEVGHDDDFITIISPGAEVLIGNPNSTSFGNIFVREDFYFYTDQNDLDHQDFNAFLEGHLRGEHYKSDLEVSFVQKAQNTPNTNAIDRLIRSNVTSVVFRDLYEWSPKTTFEASPAFKHVNYRTQLTGIHLVDHYVYDFPFAVYYKYSPKLEIGPSYKYKHTDLKSDQQDFNDHFYALALRSKITETLTLDVHLGLTHRVINNTINRTTLGTKLGLVWTKFDKLVVLLKVFRDFGVGGLGDSMLNTGAYLRGDYNASEKIDMHLALSYNHADYQLQRRNDHSSQAEYEISYKAHKAVTLAAGYTFQNNESDEKGASYSNHMAFIRAEIRY